MPEWRPMHTAPKDGSEVWINTFWGPVVAYRLDCAWLREPCAVTGLPGDPTITDCWRQVLSTVDGDDIELKDALGWLPRHAIG